MSPSPGRDPIPLDLTGTSRNAAREDDHFMMIGGKGLCKRTSEEP